VRNRPVLIFCFFFIKKKERIESLNFAGDDFEKGLEERIF
jgi:hypothetical protein